MQKVTSTIFIVGAALIFVYLILVPLGVVEPRQRYDVVDVGLLAVLLLFSSGLIDRLADVTVGSLSISLRIKELTKKQHAQQEDLTAVIRLLIGSLIPRYEVDKLRGLARSGPFYCQYHPELYPEVRDLDLRRLVKTCKGAKLIRIKDYKGKSEKFNLKEFVEITPKGREFLELHDQLTRSA